MTSRVTYEGNLRCTNVHISSMDTFLTDAPVDNNGKGAAFSPTDCLATSLASCMLTIMGIQANSMAVSIEGSSANVHKTMGTKPRRVVKIKLELNMLGEVSFKQEELLEKAAMECPVFYSLHPDIIKDISFHWK